MIQLYNDDCYEKIKDIPDNSVDLVIIDPPYLYTTATWGGAFGYKNRSYHAEYDSVSQHTPLDQRKRKNREELRVISSGFNYGLFDELCRTLKEKGYDLYIITKKQDDELSVGLFNLSIDECLDPVVELADSFGSAEFINCSGELKGDKIYLSDLNPYTFSAIILKK